MVGPGLFGNPRHHKVRELVESGEAAEALLLLWCYYLLTSFLALDNAEFAVILAYIELVCFHSNAFVLTSQT